MSKKKMGAPSWAASAKAAGKTLEEYKRWRMSQRNKGLKIRAKAEKEADDLSLAMKRGHVKRKLGESDESVASRRSGAVTATEAAYPHGGVSEPRYVPGGLALGLATYREHRVNEALMALAALTDSDRTELRKRMAAVGEWK